MGNVNPYITENRRRSRNWPPRHLCHMFKKTVHNVLVAVHASTTYGNKKRHRPYSKTAQKVSSTIPTIFNF